MPEGPPGREPRPAGNVLHDVFVGRQPIYDRRLGVVGYELLFRAGGQAESAEFADPDQASTQVILNTFVEIGLEQLVGDKPAFLNLTRSFLLGEYSFPFPRNRVVLEILESIEVDDSVVAAVRGLTQRGYQIALDDFTNHPRLRPLLELADIVKLDVLQCDRRELQARVAELRRHDVRLLAEKIETQEMYEFCHDEGFDYFQGYFLCRPKTVGVQVVRAGRLASLRLLSRVQDPAIHLDELEQIIRQDVGLSFKLLRLVNSAFHTLPVQIQSIRQTLLLLGLQRIRAWASLLLLAGIEEKPQELMVTAMVRARMCERLGVARGDSNVDAYFTAGLFSALDAIMDMPLEEVLRELPLSGELADALLRGAGRIGEAVACVVAYERGEWERVALSGIDSDHIARAYLEAVRWATEAGREMAPTGH